jgi:hypothetical protein
MPRTWCRWQTCAATSGVGWAGAATAERARALAQPPSGWNTGAQFVVGHLTGASALSPKITLQLRFPDRAPETVTLGPGRTMVGRESGDLILHDLEASALHAEIEFTKGAVIVRDLGSRNGTWREGKRLPQFALYRGQSFRCGTTDITLVEIEAEGATPAIAGGTASGSQRVGDEVGPSSSTLPSSSSMTTAQTLVRGLVFPPSTSGTAPGTEPVPTAEAPPHEDTRVGQPPPPMGPGAFAASSGTAPGIATQVAGAPSFPGVPVGVAREASAPVAMPGFQGAPVGAPGYVGAEPSAPVAVPPYAAPVGIPGYVGAESSAPVAVPPYAAPVGGYPPGVMPPPGVPGPVPAAASAPIGVPMPVAAAPSAPLAVANAVIKLGDAQPRSSKQRSPVDRAARSRLIKRVLLGTGIVAVVIGLFAGIHALLEGRNQKFLRELADELPQDTVGVLALSSPREALALLGTEIQPEIREEAKQTLGLDPFDVATFEAWGFDVDAPVGVSLLDGTGMVAVSAGVKDHDALKASLSSKAAAVIKAKEDLRWIERSFGDVPGLWLDEPMSVAALLPGKRVIFVLGGDADAVARHAKRVAEAKQGETLADRPGFDEIAPETGKLLLALYVDGASGRAAIPGDGLQLMAMRASLADFDGVAFMLADDGPRLHVSAQTIMREGMTSVEAFQGVRRKGELLDKIPAPALAELDAVFAPESFRGLLGGGLLQAGMASAMEQ